MLSSAFRLLLASVAALALPVVLGLGAASVRPVRPFAAARFSTGLAAAAAALVGLGWLVGDGPAGEHPLGVRLDALTVTMVALVTALAVVLVRYSDRYLDGDSGRTRYVRWFLGTLAAVTALVVTDHLLVLALAWTATSLCLHQLLTFYEHRPDAHVAAHQKFLVSRLADVCMLGAVGLVFVETGSARLGILEAHVVMHGVSIALHGAAVLVALAVALKSAQLPFHGWLLKVMEAPTPVSALLHAGVVNVGGFVAIRLSPWLGRAPAALTLLVVVGSLTTVVAALVMKRQSTVKSALAWSTTAQMGFMLVQCGLGAWDLALLHLVAHSLYKAHAFLSSGEVVFESRVASLVPTAAPSLGRVLGAATVASVAIVATAALGASRLGFSLDTATLALALFVACSLAVPLARVPSGALPVGLLGAVAFAGLYFGWHVAFARLWPGASLGGPAWAVAAFALASLALLQAALEARAGGALARVADRIVHLGGRLDAGFMRLAFALWPPRLPEPTSTEALAQPQEVA